MDSLERTVLPVNYLMMDMRDLGDLFNVGYHPHYLGMEENNQLIRYDITILS
jgi:hypothetical protein